MEYNVMRFVMICVSMMVLLQAAEVEGKKESSRSRKSTKTESRGLFRRKQSSKSFENPQDYKTRCCQNGGRCIMGAFCECPKNYYGRYCEYKSENRPCNKVAHGLWARSGCHLCRCFDGIMDCIPRAYRGCDDKPVNVRDKYDPNDEVYIFTPEPTKEYYDDYEEEYYHMSKASLINEQSHVFSVLLVWTIYTVILK